MADSHSAPLFPDLVFQKNFEKLGADLDTDFACPECRYEWSGDPLQGYEREPGDDRIIQYACPKCKHAWAGKPKPADVAARTPEFDRQRGVVNTVTVKPPYRIPLMTEIARIKATNGLRVVSTFSGCGGSCLGFEMAGYQVLWASEFIPEAAKTYEANHPGVILDRRDIRQVTPEGILEQIGMKAGELDVLEGSPPCASFSTAGKKHEGWGKVRKYSDSKQRTDDLFWEFARILRGLKPKVFVAENVSGLFKGQTKGYFLEILKELKSCGYVVEARLLDASLLGVPQARHRVIFVGVREDLNLKPAFPEPLPYVYTVRDALPWIVRHGTAPPHEDFVKSGRDVESTMVDSDKHPSPTIVASGDNKGVGYVDSLVGERVVHDTSGEFSQGDVTDKPAPTVVAQGHHLFVEKDASMDDTAIGREWDTLKEGEKSEKYLNLVRPSAEKPCPTITAAGGHHGTAAVTHPTERRKFSILELKRICSFPDDFVLTGTYAQQWERLGRSVPPRMMESVAKTIKEKILCAG